MPNDDTRNHEIEADTQPAPVQQQRRRIDGLVANLRHIPARWRVLVPTLALIAALGFAGSYYYLEYRPDRQTDNTVAREVVQAASEGAVAILSYAPDTLSQDFDNAKSRLTGDFLDYYGRFTEQIVAPTAQRGLVTTTAKVIRAATSELHPGSAVVLAFINQKTAGKDHPKPIETGASVLITLVKVNGTWLISKFDPV